MLRKVIVLIVLSFIAGCGRAPTLAKDSLLGMAGRTEGQYAKNYRMGKQQEAYVGEPIIKVVGFTSLRDVVPTQDFVLEGEYLKKNLFNYRLRISFQKGEPLSPIGTVSLGSEGQYFVCNVKDAADEEWSILVSQDLRINPKYLLNDDKDYLLVSKDAAIYPPTAGVEVITRSLSDKKKPRGVEFTTTNYELLFQGQNDIALNIGYREFTPSDIARPAFYQNLTYPPSAKEIRFKNTLIRIDEVNPKKIIYTVLEDGIPDGR